MKRERIQRWVWLCLSALVVAWPRLAMASKEPSDRLVISMIGAVVSVPCGLILIALIVRAYWRLHKDIPLSEREKESFPKKMKWTWVLTFVPFLAITSESINNCNWAVFGLAMSILIPTTLLGYTSHTLNHKLKCR